MPLPPGTAGPQPPHGRHRRKHTWLGRASAWFDRHVPKEEELAKHRWLRPVAHRLAEPALWRMSTDSVARGAAIGVFWAFAIPVAQIVVAAAHCVWWRGNIPVAAAITFVTNPFTVGFWLWLGYKLGSQIVAPGVTLEVPSIGILGWLQQFGLPTLVGMGIFAVGGSLLAYLLVHAASRLWVQWRYVRRLRRRYSRR